MRACLLILSLSTGAAFAQERPHALGELTSKGRERARAELNYLQAQSILDYKSGQTHRMLVLQAMLYIPDSVDAVGMTHQIDIIDLTDANGHDMLAPSQRTGQLVFAGPKYYGSIAQVRGESGPGGPIAVSNSINGLAEIPTAFQTIKGKAYLLVARRRVSCDVWPVRVGSLTELVPSLAVQITHFKKDAGNVELRFRYDATHDGPFFNPNVQPPFVDAISLIDDRGQEIRGRGGAPQKQEPQGNIFQGEGRIAFALPEGRKPAGLKFLVVTDVQEQEVEFESHNLKMPLEE